MSSAASSHDVCREEVKRFGVDTGGTFTDVVARDTSGALHVHKLLSSPSDPSEAISDGVHALLDASDKSFSLVHGTTVATNALLERRGARALLFTTWGFEDLLELARQNRPDLYTFQVRRPPPLILPEDCLGVRERVRFDGSVEVALEEEEVGRILDEVARRRDEIDAVAICFLHAYAYPEHELKLASRLRDAFPDLFVSASAEIVREFREYERASTTSVNAYVGPVMSRYLERLSSRLSAADEIEIFESSGARASIERTSRFPVHTALSGPAGGVVGAMAVARELGIDRIITFDMGGTSTDVALCDGGATLGEMTAIGDLPLLVPMLDIHTVGAGGGSIAFEDEGGALRVGPRSAGADPGPVCYGRGGRQPTVTDAHLVLGRLREDRFLGGDMSLDKSAAHRSIESLAKSLGLDVEETAAGILSVADAAMVRAIKVISLERGHDPRDFALVSFGGAGGLHACRMAEALDMTRVVIPRNPGLLSAYGMLHAERVQYFAQTTVMRVDAITSSTEGKRALIQVAEALDARARQASARGAGYAMRYAVDLRYVGQSFALRCEVDWNIEDPTEDFALPLDAFEARHEELYGWSAPGKPIELVTLRGVAAWGSGDGTESSSPEPHAATPRASSLKKKTLQGDVRVFFDGGEALAALLERSDLEEGDCFEGPCVITEYSGTAVIPEGWRVRVERGHLVAERHDIGIANDRGEGE